MEPSSPPRKRRLNSKLRAFGSPSKASSSSVDGRVRSKPHVQGVWPSHLYLEVSLPSDLATTLHEVISVASDSLPMELQSLLESTAEDEEMLHLSVSRPLYPRTSDRQALLMSCGSVAQDVPATSASFAAFTLLHNDDKTRSFLSLELGHGHNELRRLTDALNKHLSSLGLETYYDPPRFHCSVAWFLPAPQESDSHDIVDQICSALVQDLDREFGTAVRQHQLRCSSLCARIGKDVTRFLLK